MGDRSAGAWPDVRHAGRLVPIATAGVAATSVIAAGTAAARGSSAVSALSAGLLVPILLAVLAALGLGAAFAGVSAWAATTVQGRRELAAASVGLVATVVTVALVWTVLPGISSPPAPRITAIDTRAGAAAPADVRVGTVLLAPRQPVIGPRPQPSPPVQAALAAPGPQRRAVSRTDVPGAAAAPQRTTAPQPPTSRPTAAPDAAPPTVLPVVDRLGRPSPPSTTPGVEPATNPPHAPVAAEELAAAEKTTGKKVTAKKTKREKRTHRHGPKVRGHRHSPRPAD